MEICHFKHLSKPHSPCENNPDGENIRTDIIKYKGVQEKSNILKFRNLVFWTLQADNKLL